MTENSIPDNILDGNPDADELITYARTAEWDKLGIKLKLDGVSLQGCRDYDDMYQKWIGEKTKSETTRRKLIAALRAIKQNRVADDYIEYLKTLVSLYNRIMYLNHICHTCYLIEINWYITLLH